MEIKTPIEWNDFAEDFLDADGNIFRADQIATALNLATDREKRLVEALEQDYQTFSALYDDISDYELERHGDAISMALTRITNALATHKGEK